MKKVGKPLYEGAPILMKRSLPRPKVSIQMNFPKRSPFGEIVKDELPMSRICAAAIFFASVLPSPSLALTAEDVMKMSKDERYGYLTGAIDMLSFHAARDGRTERVNCILKTYYGHGGDMTGWSRVYDALDKFKDTEPTTIVALLVEKACGK